MKRLVTYETLDGKSFPTRKQALLHETNRTRREAFAKFLLARLQVFAATETVAVSKLVDLMCENPGEVSRLLSARNARTLAKLPGPRRGVRSPREAEKPHRIAPTPTANAPRSTDARGVSRAARWNEKMAATNVPPFLVSDIVNCPVQTRSDRRPYVKPQARPARASRLRIEVHDYDPVVFEQFPGLLAELKRPTPRFPGFWNVRHALFTAEEFITTFSLDAPAARTARALVALTHESDAPICHTMLARPPDEWVMPLTLKPAQTKPEDLAQGVIQLSKALIAAGLRPLNDQPPPVVSADTPLHTVSRLAGAGFIHPVITAMLHGGGVGTIAQLCMWPPSHLTGKPSIDWRNAQTTVHAK